MQTSEPWWKRLRLQFVLPMIGVGSALLGLYRCKADLDAIVQMPSALYVSALVLGATLIVSGVVLLAFCVAAPPVRAGFAWISTTFADNSRYECRSVGPIEFGAVRQFWANYFGDEVLSVNGMAAWYQRNPDLFWVMEEIRPSGDAVEHRLVGSFSLIPLKKKAAAQLETEGITVHTLPLDQIVGPYGRPRAIYIGGAVASNRRARAACLAALQERLRTYRKRGIPIYTRTLSPDGLRLVRSHGFRAVLTSAPPDELGHIYKLEEVAQLPQARARRGKRIVRQEPTAAESAPQQS